MLMAWYPQISAREQEGYFTIHLIESLMPIALSWDSRDDARACWFFCFTEWRSIVSSWWKTWTPRLPFLFATNLFATFPSDSCSRYGGFSWWTLCILLYLQVGQICLLQGSISCVLIWRVLIVWAFKRFN